MYGRLPEWQQSKGVQLSNETRWVLSNGSRALAFSTRSGRSYTGTLAIVDEADFVPELSQFLNAVKPTIDAGGQLFLISTSDKKRPISTFKNLFRAAVAGHGDYKHVFLPWWARPGRDDAWRQSVQAEMFAQRGTNDDFFAEYPATPEEALAAEQLDRRLPLDWLKRCMQTELGGAAGRGSGGAGPGGVGAAGAGPPLRDRRGSGRRQPQLGRICRVRAGCGELGAGGHARGQGRARAFAGYVDQVGMWFNGADVLPERNNHGHLFIREIERLGPSAGAAGLRRQPGWLSNIKGKPLFYGLLADAVHEGVCVVRDSETAVQLASIEASTLRAPEGLHDDRATAFALAGPGVEAAGAIEFGFEKL